MRPRHPHAGRFSHRRSVLTVALILLAVAAPWAVGTWVDGGPKDARAFTGTFAVSGVMLILGAWILSLIRRERRTAARHAMQLERLTLTDPLTGLGNRRALELDLARALQFSERVAVPMALVYLEVDGFKGASDRGGQAVDDETLRALGAVLRSCSRLGTDTAYRVGGDEFVMTLVADRDAAEAVAQRAARDFLQRSPRQSSFTHGVVVWDGKSTAAALVDEARTRAVQSRFGTPWARQPAEA